LILSVFFLHFLIHEINCELISGFILLLALKICTLFAGIPREVVGLKVSGNDSGVDNAMLLTRADEWFRSVPLHTIGNGCYGAVSFLFEFASILVYERAQQWHIGTRLLESSLMFVDLFYSNVHPIPPIIPRAVIDTPRFAQCNMVTDRAAFCIWIGLLILGLRTRRVPPRPSAAVMFQARILRNCLDTDKDNAHTLNHKRALLLLALVDLFNGDTTSVPTLCSSVLCSPIGIEGADEYEDNSVPAYLQASAMLIHYFAACGGTQMDLRIDRRLDSSSTIVASNRSQLVRLIFSHTVRNHSSKNNFIDITIVLVWLCHSYPIASTAPSVHLSLLLHHRHHERAQWILCCHLLEQSQASTPLFSLQCHIDLCVAMQDES
jgi:hypothetical protein